MGGALLLRRRQLRRLRLRLRLRLRRRLRRRRLLLQLFGTAGAVRRPNFAEVVRASSHG